jgi:hypothetical protein
MKKQEISVEWPSYEDAIIALRCIRNTQFYIPEMDAIKNMCSVCILALEKERQKTIDEILKELE